MGDENVDPIGAPWRKYIFIRGYYKRYMAEDILNPSEYAVFPGTKALEEKIIYSRIAHD